jgi:DNA-binding transcriptional LysR family regulator
MQGLPQLTFIPLSGIDLVFVTAAGDPLAKKKEVTWDDLKQASWILNQEGCQFRAYRKAAQGARADKEDRGRDHRLRAAKAAHAARIGHLFIAQDVRQERDTARKPKNPERQGNQAPRLRLPGAAQGQIRSRADEGVPKIA